MITAAQNNLWLKKENEFVNLIDGKKLNRFLIELSVRKDGSITGIGTDVTGTWNWQDNYFCRNLSWGNRDLGSDYQKEELKDQNLFFTSNLGRGGTAGLSVK